MGANKIICQPRFGICVIKLIDPPDTGRILGKVSLTLHPAMNYRAELVVLGIDQNQAINIAQAIGRSSAPANHPLVEFITHKPPINVVVKFRKINDLPIFMLRAQHRPVANAAEVLTMDCRDLVIFTDLINSHYPPA